MWNAEICSIICYWMYLFTCFEVQVQLVGVSIERPAELHLYLESLSPADDQLLPVIQVGVMLPSVLTRLWAEQVHRTHRQLYFWEKGKFIIKCLYVMCLCHCCYGFDIWRGSWRVIVIWESWAEPRPNNFILQFTLQTSATVPSISFASPFSGFGFTGSGAGVGGLTNSTLSVIS